MKRVTIIALALIAGACGGYRYEANAVEATCQSDTAATVINGRVYMCVTAAQAMEIQRRMQERGA